LKGHDETEADSQTKQIMVAAYDFSADDVIISVMNPFRAKQSNWRHPCPESHLPLTGFVFPLT
jgi:hypothetical protein